MYQGRKFEFFEEKHIGKCAIPEEVTRKIKCCSSRREKVVIGCDDGAICLLDRGLKFNYGFSAHSSSVLFLQQLKEDTLTMRKEIQGLRTNARICQLSKCTACTFTLDLPAVHFMCMQSFHLRCLGDNEMECPECALEYRSVFEMKTSLEKNSKDQDRFF